MCSMCLITENVNNEQFLIRVFLINIHGKHYPVYDKKNIFEIMYCIFPCISREFSELFLKL